MSTMPTLPFVVLQTHRPSSTTEIIAAATAATTAATAPAAPGAVNAGLSSSSVSSLKPPRSPTSPAPASRTGSGSGPTGLLPISPGGTRPSSSINHTHSLPGSSSTRARADSAAAAISSTIPPSSSSSSLPSAGPSIGAISSPGSGNSSNSSAPSTVQIRTLHPQVHYIFENDPLEAEILESVPKSQSIALDFDPRTGTIQNVESFLTYLQVMDVKLVPFQATLPALSTSSSATSLNSMMSGMNSHNAGGESHQQPQQQQQQQQHRSTTAPTLGRTNSSGASSINSSMTTSATKMTRRPSERSLGNHAGTGGEGEDKVQAGVVGGAGKDWTLVINAVEVDGKELDSESELLEQSMLSSFDTDMGTEDSLAYSDALLKSFQTRNMLVRKVIDYTTSTSSAGSTPQ